MALDPNDRESIKVSGDFTATGVSNYMPVSNRGRVKINFVGSATGSVVLQEYNEYIEDWQDTGTGDTFTETGVRDISGGNQNIRLNCTAITGTIEYLIRP